MDCAGDQNVLCVTNDERWYESESYNATGLVGIVVLSLGAELTELVMYETEIVLFIEPELHATIKEDPMRVLQWMVVCKCASLRVR